MLSTCRSRRRCTRLRFHKNKAHVPRAESRGEPGAYANKKGVSAKVEGKSTLRNLLLGMRKIVDSFIYTASKKMFCKVILYLKYIFSNYYFIFL